MRRIIIGVVVLILVGLLAWRTVDALRARRVQGVSVPRPAGAGR